LVARAVQCDTGNCLTLSRCILQATLHASQVQVVTNAIAKLLRQLLEKFFVFFHAFGKEIGKRITGAKNISRFKTAMAAVVATAAEKATAA
jgi:hypothetical protein